MFVVLVFVVIFSHVSNLSVCLLGGVFVDQTWERCLSKGGSVEVLLRSVKVRWTGLLRSNYILLLTVLLKSITVYHNLVRPNNVYYGLLWSIAGFEPEFSHCLPRITGIIETNMKNETCKTTHVIIKC